MSRQWTGTIIGVTRVGAGFTGGITGNTTYTFGGDFVTSTAGINMWDGAVFGISVTTFNGVNFSCYVVGNVAGITIPIAGWSGIGSTTTLLLPIVNEVAIGTVAGTTQYSFAQTGIPIPTAVTFGNSAIVGKSYSAVVYAKLYNGR